MPSDQADPQASASGQYQGSQAFAHVLPGKDEAINPNTGSLNFRKSLVDLRGVRSSVDLNLTVSYAAGSFGAFGMPRNWTLDLPYVVPGKSITFSGRTYAIDPFWSDSQGFQSGLKYMNNHGIKFNSVVPPQPLPFGKKRDYAYKLRLQDGSTDYFDKLGRPLAHGDIFGNAVHYFYLPGPSQGVLSSQPCLDCILDSWDQRISFTYQPGLRMTISGPDSSKTTVGFSNIGINLITDTLGLETRFTYAATVISQQLLSSITYATGLTSRFDYTALEYLDTGHATKHVPAVSDHYHLDSQGQVLEHTNYRFGFQSAGLTFTGKSLGCKLGGPKDELMEAGHSDYKYDVMKSGIDQSGKVVSAKLTWFNYLHLPVSETKYLVGSHDALIQVYQTRFTYRIDPNQHARTTSYSQPETTEQFHNIATDGTTNWQALRRTSTNYNSYGESTLQQDELCVNGTTYVKTRTVTQDYFKTSLGIQMLKTKTEFDSVSETLSETQNLLSTDEKAVATSATFLKGKSDDAKKAWKVRSYQYDSHGRVTQESISWADGVAVPEHSAKSAVSSTTFDFQNGSLIESRSDSSAGVTASHFDMTACGGPMIKRVLPLGQTESFEYDRIGRLLKYTDALGATTTTTYIVSASSNNETTIDAQGFTRRTTYDALGRTVEEVDNGDSTQLIKDPTRTLKWTSYDTLGQLKTTTDILGLTTSYLFDGLGRPLETTDPEGNTVRNVYDDSLLTIRQTLNGDPRKDAFMDGYGQLVRQVTYSDSGDSSAAYSLVQEMAYDGSGHQIKEDLYQDPTKHDAPPRKLLKTRSTLFDGASQVISEAATGGGDSGDDTVTRTFVYDLFGNKYSWTKETKYDDGRIFLRKGPITVYDMHGNVILLRNQLDQEESNSYNDNGWITSTTKFDGSVLKFQHDSCGQTIQTSSKSTVTDIKYKSKGQIESIEQQGPKMTFEYFADGTVKSVDYGNGHVQRYTRDKASRVTKDIDVFGTTKETHYDEFGHIASVASGGDVVSFKYGSVNHTSGQLVGYELSGKHTYTHMINYDGFNGTSRVRTLNSDSTVLLDTKYSINGRRQIASTQCTSALRPELNKVHSWLYDGIGQVVQESVSSTSENEVISKFAYDGNFNILSYAVGGQTTNMTYNEIDQRTDAGFKYDPNGRLLLDGEGTQYEFDDLDRLVSARVADHNQVELKYHSDDSLGVLARPNESTNFFYTRNGKVNAVGHEHNGQSKQANSLLRISENIIATYDPSASPLYFFEKLGSTALQLSGQESTAIEYNCYGSSKSTPALKSNASFAFGQELVEQLTGLVYLRSRFYHPRNMSFISMDSYHMENRYAYCQGDPVNLFDPSGHVSVWKVLGTITAAVAGTIASVATFGGATAGFAAGLAAMGVAETTIASVGVTAAIDVTSGAIAGAVGNVAGSVVSQIGDVVAGGDWEYGLGNLGQDVATGAAGGAFAAGTGRLLGTFGASARLSEWTAAIVDVGVQKGTSWRVYDNAPEFDWQTLGTFAISLGVGRALGGAAAARARQLQREAVWHNENHYREMVGYAPLSNSQGPSVEMQQLNDLAVHPSGRPQIRRGSRSVLQAAQEGCKDALGDWLSRDRRGPGGAGAGAALAQRPLLRV